MEDLKTWWWYGYRMGLYGRMPKPSKRQHRNDAMWEGFGMGATERIKRAQQVQSE
jgi:hypothetical protein